MKRIDRCTVCGQPMCTICGYCKNLKCEACYCIELRRSLGFPDATTVDEIDELDRRWTTFLKERRTWTE